ncbi:MAG: glycosyltransferase [Chitinophagaceae bacterium]|nr:glycosyltransferase [Chitinophagaceae bacterium]
MITISIITICYNNLNDLEKTCKSVDEQIVSPFEHIIINGSSNNEIESWAEKKDHPVYRYFVHEKDNGIADAFNKGILKSKGEVIHLLNAGDIYAKDSVLQTVIEFFEANTDIQWISAKIRLSRGGEKVIIGKPFDKNKLYRGMRSVLHPTYFLKRSVYNRVGYFSSNWKIAMDYDLLCRLGNEPYAFIPDLFIDFDDTGISNTAYVRSLQENLAVYKSHFGKSILAYAWNLRLYLLHYLLSSKLGKWLFQLKKRIGLENF